MIGGWRWTSRSPTGSGPEGSSPNEFRSGRCPVSAPSSGLIQARAFFQSGLNNLNDNAPTAETELSPAEKRQIERRAAIVDAALKVFARDGFAAAKMDDVALEAGVAKGTIYLYHASKEELFQEAVRAKLLPIIDAVDRLSIEFTGPAEDLLSAQIGFVYEHLVETDVAQIMRLMIAEGPRFPSLTEFYEREIIRRGEAVMQRTLDYGTERGEFVPPQGEFVGKILMGPAMMVALWRLVFSDHRKVDTQAFLQTHIDFVLRGLRP